MKPLHSPLVKMVRTCTHSHTNMLYTVFPTQFKVVLARNPTLGLGITGGIDGENAIVPGDKVSHAS